MICFMWYWIPIVMIVFGGMACLIYIIWAMTSGWGMIR